MRTINAIPHGRELTYPKISKSIVIGENVSFILWEKNHSSFLAKPILRDVSSQHYWECRKNGLKAGPPRITLQSRPAKRVAAAMRPRSDSASYLCTDRILTNQKLLSLLPVLGEPNASTFMLTRKAGLTWVASTSHCALLFSHLQS